MALRIGFEDTSGTVAWHALPLIGAFPNGRVAYQPGDAGPSHLFRNISGTDAAIAAHAVLNAPLNLHVDGFAAIEVAAGRGDPGDLRVEATGVVSGTITTGAGSDRVLLGTAPAASVQIATGAGDDAIRLLPAREAPSGTALANWGLEEAFTFTSISLSVLVRLSHSLPAMHELLTEIAGGAPNLGPDVATRMFSSFVDEANTLLSLAHWNGRGPVTTDELTGGDHFALRDASGATLRVPGLEAAMLTFDTRVNLSAEGALAEPDGPFSLVSGASMTAAEARAVLGLGPAADLPEVRAGAGAATPMKTYAEVAAAVRDAVTAILAARQELEAQLDSNMAAAPPASPGNEAGTPGRSEVHLGAGHDRFSGHDGLDLALGGAGNDSLDGGGGADTLLGGAGSDTLRDWAGDDRLGGGEGNDDLFGGQGDDTLVGGSGDDVLWNADGDDVLRGSDGADRFVFALRSHWETASRDRDVIADFNPHEGDRLLTMGRGDLADAGLEIIARPDGVLLRFDGSSVLLRGVASLDRADILFG